MRLSSAAVALCLSLLVLQALVTSQAAAAAAGSPSAKDQVKMQQQEMSKHATDKDGDGKAEQHDTSFDHEMFLGKEGSREFSGLQAQEGKKRLGELFDTKIDANKDGKVSKEELTTWMHRVAEEHIKRDVDENWHRFNKTDGQLLTWGEFAATKLPYALPNFSDKHLADVLKTLQGSDAASIAKSGGLKLDPPPKDAADDAKSLQDSLVTDLVREARRWVAADGDKDGKLSKSELHQFYYPDEFPHMRAVLAQESMDHADKNKDGKVSLEEFLQDMWNPTKESDEKEPDWVGDERKSFKEVKDKNKDGFLDKKEFTEYLFSHDQERSELYKREAEHLISEADADKDGALSRKEIVDNLELFAGSAATNYGDHIGMREDL